ncbi:S8 family serine peptidase [Nitratireductor sp. B36]|uniref:S8 family serine peptidase n=1 Tax=Nitratireductor sp. B36 TaxID=2762059 RepID=UPI001E4422B7|nr:S8 family serine peptidase [Nitratireductor sp. B36]MCC5779267.1 S8 family serine peptidase [Nitratireductor sp. B36]
MTRLVSRMLAAIAITAQLAMAAHAQTTAPAEAGGGETQARAASGERRVVYLPQMLAELFGPGTGEAALAQPAASGDAPETDGNASGGGAGQTVPPPTTAGAGANARPVAPQRAISGAFVPDEVLVTLDGDADVAAAVAAQFGLELRSARGSALLGRTVARFGIPDVRPVAFVLAQLEGDGRLSDRVPNHVFQLQQAAGVVNYAFERIALDAGAASGENVSVAVIDTALDEAHPALVDRVARVFDALPDMAVKDREHGTSISGLIAGDGPFRGMAPGVRLLHARAFEGGISSTNVLLAALDWAVEEGAQIVNMSFVGPENPLFSSACRNAMARGVVLVAAAGNNGPGAPFGYPAAYDGVIAVTATDVHDRVMGKANRGRYIDLSAPGVNVVAPIPGGMDVVTGTSFAAAIVSGAIANLIHAGEDAEPETLSQLLRTTAVDLGRPGRDDDFGDGLLNTRAAMEGRTAN